MPRPDRVGHEAQEIGSGHASEIVELLVLTGDAVFLEMLRAAAGQMRRVWQASSADGVGELLTAGAVGILVMDSAMLPPAEAPAFIVGIKRQFPDLVILLAGDRDSEAALAALISAGTVYRFIHKPVSPGRAKSFAEAAVKRLIEQRTRRGASREATATRARRDWLIGASAALAAMTLAAALLLQRSAPADAPAEEGVRVAAGAALAEPPLLSQAAAALAANRLTGPKGDNALELYRQVLLRDPLNAGANAGIAEVRERLVTAAEVALFAERLDAAAAAIGTARQAGVERGRIALLAAELAAARSQIAALRAAAADPVRQD